mmetsp:Transcript_25537/g.64367  ORF Transcript_25537/g.64367 Transcript_25537/m.64367 type:complete len:207 (-) Transcript_25537:1282-1902(-)
MLLPGARGWWIPPPEHQLPHQLLLFHHLPRRLRPPRLPPLVHLRVAASFSRCSRFVVASNPKTSAASSRACARSTRGSSCRKCTCTAASLGMHDTSSTESNGSARACGGCPSRAGARSSSRKNSPRSRGSNTSRSPGTRCSRAGRARTGSPAPPGRPRGPCVSISTPSSVHSRRSPSTTSPPARRFLPPAGTAAKTPSETFSACAP